MPENKGDQTGPKEQGTQGAVGQGARMKIPEIAQRLDVGRLAVYAMLEQGLLPGIRLGKRWIVTRHAYLEWERSAGRQVA
jgi:excisionase family DNA binding protein